MYRSTVTERKRIEWIFVSAEMKPTGRIAAQKESGDGLMLCFAECTNTATLLTGNPHTE